MSAYADEIERELAERYVELPLDADEVPIHMGDVISMDGRMEGSASYPDYVQGFESRDVIGITYHGSGKATVCVDEPQLRWHDVRHVRHHQPDTWERIIEDAVKMGVYDHDNERIKAKLIERCRALAGDAE